MSGTGGASIGAAARRGRAVAALHARVAPELFDELCAVGHLAEGDARAAARAEWDALSAYACVRALVAAFGFGPEGAETVDAFHDAVFEGVESGKRTLVAARYDTYGAIVREAGTGDAAAIAGRLGVAAAARMTDSDAPDLAELAGALHEALYEAALALSRKEA